MTETEADAAAASPDKRNGDVSGVELVFDRVTKRYPGQRVPAVNELSLQIPAGETVMFVGPSGCGKTTSLKMINRLIEPSSGTIRIGDQDVRKQSADELRRTIGYVIQGGSLFPHMTVAQNIALVPGLLKWDKSRTKNRVDELLEMVNLEPGKYRDRYPRELSGGQQQRVGVARGLAADPPVILMDEPFGAVDPITRARLQDEMMAIQEELRKTIVCVTHDIDEAIKLGDRILILQEGARIAQYDTPEAILAGPANEFVEDFVGAGSALKSLSLARVGDVPLSDDPAATVGERVADVKERAASSNHPAVVVLDEQRRPLDWVFLRQFKGDEVVDSGRRTLGTLDRHATLSDALDAMLSSGHGGAVVTGRNGEYLGVIRFQAVTDYIASLENEHADTEPEAGAGHG